MIERISAVEAHERARKNKLRRYPDPKRDGERLYPLANPIGTPSFTIARSDTIFTIGSCFARNVEGALTDIGMNVLSREMKLGPIGDSLGQATNMFNKYSIHSIYNELKWAFEPETFPAEKLIYKMRGENHYADLQLGMAKLEFPLEEIMRFRRRYLEVMARAAEADVIIVTLGYVESWYDRELGIYLNGTPNQHLMKEFPERFEFRVLSYQDILEGLRDLYALLQKHRTKPLKMLITVSPVPLLSTFRDMDVLLANTYSKSVQRAAIEEFLLETEGVDYFPSYEFVILSNPSIAWSRGDYRHVSPDLVARIMFNVLTTYVEDSEAVDSATTADPDMTPQALQSTVRMMMKLKDYEGVLKLEQEQPEPFAEDPELMIMLGNSHVGLRNLEVAMEQFLKLVEKEPQRPMPLERLISLCRPTDQREMARELLKEHERRFPGRSNFRDSCDWL